LPRTVGGDEQPLEHFYEILRSAKKLRDQDLNLEMFERLQQCTAITQRFLESTASHRFTRVTLTCVKVDEKVLLKALTRWTPSLHTLHLGRCRLFSVHKGWLAVLRALGLMPKLRYLHLCKLSERHDGMRDTDFNTILVSLGPKLTRIVSQGPQAVYAPAGLREYKGRREVVSGLEELLAEPLKYETWQGRYAGYRNAHDYVFR
jgi:hypothetical protein